MINNGKKARFFNALDLFHALIKEQADGDAGKIIPQLSALDCVIIDKFGYIPSPKSGGALLFHLISKLCEKKWIAVFGDAMMTTAPSDRVTHHCAIIETGNR